MSSTNVIYSGETPDLCPFGGGTFKITVWLDADQQWLCLRAEADPCMSDGVIYTDAVIKRIDLRSRFATKQLRRWLLAHGHEREHIIKVCAAVAEHTRLRPDLSGERIRERTRYMGAANTTVKI